MNTNKAKVHFFWGDEQLTGESVMPESCMQLWEELQTKGFMVCPQATLLNVYF